MTVTRIGTHNLLDGQAQARGFARIIMFCEAPVDIFDDSVARTHRLYRARRQRDLVIALRRSMAAEVEDLKVHYKFVHPGVRLVTPLRGILWITFTYRGKKYAVICEHRINAWYRPWIRGERWFRQRMWNRHTRMSNKIQQRLLDEGYLIIAGGDPNAPEGVQAYPLLHETTGAHLDRLASSERIRSWHEAGKGGSDHERLVGLIGKREPRRAA